MHTLQWQWAKIQLSMKMIINGTFSNFNAVKEIKVPDEVIKNAISMEEFLNNLKLNLKTKLSEVRIEDRGGN